MSNHNYTQYSNYKKSTVVEPVTEVAPEVVENEPINPTIEVVETPDVEAAIETVETVAVPDPDETIEGVIVNCAKLNVRVAPNATADVATILNVASEIKIDLTKSTDEWYHVCTATGVEGYCMRKFVEARL